MLVMTLDTPLPELEKFPFVSPPLLCPHIPPQHLLSRWLSPDM